MAIRARPKKESFQMDPCPEDDLVFSRYICNELDDEELQKIFRHLLACDDCRVRLLEERRLANLLGCLRPLYLAPATLRARVSGIFTEHLTTVSQAVPRHDTRIPDLLASEPFTIGVRTAAPGLERSESPKKGSVCACFRRLRGAFWWR